MDHFKLSHTIVRFLLLVSLFSLLFSSLPLLLQSLTLFFNFTISKTHVFLLCNGLLVFIIENSALTTASSSTTSTEDSTETPEIGMSESMELDVAAPISQENGVKAQNPEEEEKEEEEEEEEEEEGNAVMIMEEDEEEEAEEVNMKCEDFIRKMKAGFC